MERERERERERLESKPSNSYLMRNGNRKELRARRSPPE
jgi:hypothetical protein